MHTRMNLSRRLVKWLPVTMLVLMLAGCGSDNDNGKKEKSDKDKKATPGLRLRFAQVHAQLDQLEREAEIQKKHISSARAELLAIQNVLANTKLDEITAAELITTGISVAPIPVKEGKVKRSDKEKEGAADHVFATLAIVLFLLFAGVYVGKIWRDRDCAPSAPQYSGADAGPATGTYYSAKSAEGDLAPGDSTSTPPPAV